MKFIVDEDVPIKLMKALIALGHDAIRVEPSSSDLVSLDKDFTNFTLFPPAEFNIIHISIHPPYADNIIEAMKKLLNTCPADKLKGIIILSKEGHMRIF